MATRSANVVQERVVQNYRLTKNWTSEEGVSLSKGTIVTQREKDVKAQKKGEDIRCLAPGQIVVAIPCEFLKPVSSNASL